MVMEEEEASRLLRWDRAWVRSVMLAAIATLLIAQASLAEAAADKRPFTVDDMLRGGGAVSSVAIGPWGRHIVLERYPLWRDLPDFATAGSPAHRKGSADLYVVDGQRPSAPKPLLKQQPDAGYWVAGFSPGGERVALYWIQNRVLKAGVFDFEDGQLTEFDFTASYGWYQLQPVWLSDDELIYSSALPGRLSPELFDRAATANRLSELWRKAWAGNEPSSTLLYSRHAGNAGAPLPRDGGLLKVNSRTGEATALGKGAFANLVVSPNKRYLAALRMGEFIQPAATAITTGLERRTQLAVFDLAGSAGETVICADCNVAVGTVEWSQDSETLLFFARRGDEPWDNGRFYRHTISTGETWRIDHVGLDLASEWEHGSVHRPERAAWVGGRLAVFARPAGDPGMTPQFTAKQRSRNKTLSRADWFLVSLNGKITNLTAAFESVSWNMLATESDALYLLADGDVWRVGSDGSRRNLTVDIDDELTSWPSRIRFPFYPRPSLPRTHLVLQKIGSGKPGVVFLNAKTGTYTSIAAPLRKARLIAASAQGQKAVYAQPADAKWNYYLAGTDGRTTLLLTTTSTRLEGITPALRHRIGYTVDGVRLTGCAYLPADWRPERRYPVIVDVYPNRVPARRCHENDGRVGSRIPELLVGRGYVVFDAHTPRKLSRTSKGPLQGLTKVVLAGVDQLIAEGYADPDRIGLFGYSQGGFAVPWILTQTNRFKAAVARHGIANYASHYGDLPLTAGVLAEEWFQVGSSRRYEAEDSEFYLGAPPWEDPDAYVRNSAYFQADKIDAPLLLIQSEMDVFPMDDYEQLFIALYRQRKEAAFVRYWGEGHTLESPANIRDMWERIFSWYDKYLKNDDSEDVAAGQSTQSTEKDSE